MTPWDDEIDRHMGPSGAGHTPAPFADAPSFGASAPEGGPAFGTSTPGAAPEAWDVPSPTQAARPTPTNVVEPLRSLEPSASVVKVPITESDVPAEETAFTEQDDFDPRYCTTCHKHIPAAISERQGVCDECLAARAALGQGTAAPPGAVVDATGTVIRADTPVGLCPNCGSHNLSVNSVLSAGAGLLGTLVDTALDVLSGTSSLDGGGWSSSGSPYRCRDCGHGWL